MIRFKTFINFLQNYYKKMKKPNFEPIFSDFSEFCEVSDDKPISTLIPGQAINLSELIQRFERGQRLNVHSNFAPGDNFTNGSVYVEDFDDAPPDDVHDVVDVYNYMQEHEQHKKDYAARKKKEKEEAQQAAQQAQQADDPTPPPAEGA